MDDRRRWGAALLGSAEDLEDAAALFALPGPFEVDVVEAHGRRHPALFSAHLDAAGDVHEAHELGVRLVERLSGSLFVAMPERGSVAFGGVLGRGCDGAWTLTVFGVASVRCPRVRLVATASITPRPGQPPPPPPPPLPRLQWMEDSFEDDALADVLDFLKGEPGWFELFKAFERMRDDAQRRAGGGWERIGGLGWPPKHEVDFFTESAQVHRHSRAKWGRYHLSTAMPLDEARRRVARLAEAWLKWRCAPADRAPGESTRR